MTEADLPAVQIADDLWLLDTCFQGEPGVIASYLLTGHDGLALVDVGSGASIAQLLEAIRASGFDPEDVHHLLLTHVHLDHAGAAGTLLRCMPHAQAYVHSIGAPHLLDPATLVASARRIYGDRTQQLWGDIEAVPENRLSILNDGDAVHVGNRTLEVLYTPGHAVHHISFYDAASGDLFAGDAGGVRLQCADYARPPTPPPDLNLEQWSASIERLQALHPHRILLPHFGPLHDPARHLTELRERLWTWGHLLLPGIRAQDADAVLAERLASISDPELFASGGPAGKVAVRRYELATNYLMSAQGYVRYYRKVHPELLGSA